ncbi:ATP-binding protein [Streptomyces sp. F63]|uniref:ATP-binding protein n=1 Tax=Streptomyces sp. F63 TaxID=2824887 RepID=UPI001B38DB73|nr:ATP-binding protein [Streptomyces sp. F63]MBQ0983833.1 ATP-binding protein [Streptomyces sp. F63]
MSLPLTRRIARAALLVAAGAAPLVGAAGPAQATGQPESTGLGGVSNLDTATLGEALDSTARQAGAGAAENGAGTVESALPAAGELLGSATRTGAPAAEKTVAGAPGAAGTLAEDTAGARPGGLRVQEFAEGLADSQGLSGVPGNLPVTEEIGAPAAPNVAYNVSEVNEAAGALTANGPLQLGG